MKKNVTFWAVLVVLCALTVLSMCVFKVKAAEDAPRDTVLYDGFMFPQKMVVMNGVDYVFDEGQLLRVTEGKAEAVAAIKTLADLKKHGIKDSDIPSFRPAHMIANDGVIYVSGNIHRDFGDQNGNGAVYHTILSWKPGDSGFKTVQWGREQDAVAPVITDWNDGENEQLMQVGKKWVFDYMGKVRTRQAMTVVNNHLYYTYFCYDQLNKEGIAYVDLKDGSVHKLLETYGFDVLSGGYFRSDYWQGNGAEYSIQVAPDEKTITIIDGDHDIYKLDVPHGKMSVVSKFYNSPDSKIAFMTKNRPRGGLNYFLNDQGIYKQTALKTRPERIFDPRQYVWSEESGIGAIADWDWVDEHTVDLLDFTNHQLIRLNLQEDDMDD